MTDGVSKSVLLVLAGTSGAGKGSIARQLLDRNPKLWLSVSATTRSPRAGERNGVEYWFLSPEEFADLEANGGFIESFVVFGKKYGTPRPALDANRAQGSDVVLEIDVQGAAKIKSLYPDALLVFVRAPSSEAQRERLLARDPQFDPELLEARLAAAAGEEAASTDFDAVVTNETLSQSVAEIEHLIAAHREAE
ncbi:MAG: guanylate kinase [Actinobacteria bacterium]|nr:guanylate kinase [Actinomycetota bacterium]